jgi:hypothetical protein
VVLTCIYKCFRTHARAEAPLLQNLREPSCSQGALHRLLQHARIHSPTRVPSCMYTYIHQGPKKNRRTHSFTCMILAEFCEPCMVERTVQQQVHDNLPPDVRGPMAAGIAPSKRNPVRCCTCTYVYVLFCAVDLCVCTYSSVCIFFPQVYLCLSLGGFSNVCVPRRQASLAETLLCIYVFCVCVHKYMYIHMHTSSHLITSTHGCG